VKFDTYVLAISVMLIASVMALLVPLYTNFGKPDATQVTIFVLVSVLAAFTLGKRLGEARNG
jgi:hypothetical protein